VGINPPPKSAFVAAAGGPLAPDLELPLLCSVNKVEERSGRVVVHLRGQAKGYDGWEIQRACDPKAVPSVGDRYLVVVRPEGSDGGLLTQDQVLALLRGAGRNWYRRTVLYIAVAWGSGVGLGAGLLMIARHLGVYRG
jgi:hypothetical protein